MRLKYDMTAGALYVRLTDAPVARTRDIDDNTMIDLDANGGVIGIEVVSIAHPWPLDEILRDYAIPAREVAELQAYFRAAGSRGGVPGTPAVSVDRNAPACVPA
jgi:uncharacterized protein YuzE